MSERAKKSNGGTAAKMLMPVIATLASAAASYLAKKGPQYVEQRLMPKLKETKEAAPAVGDVAHDLAERAKSVVGVGAGESDGDSRSMDELAKRRSERAGHRAARRKAN
jgi:hypothetical protein